MLLFEVKRIRFAGIITIKEIATVMEAGMIECFSLCVLWHFLPGKV
jgi:hypothetical protein